MTIAVDMGRKATKTNMVKMAVKGEVGGCALNSHGSYIVDHGISLKNHGIAFLNFCGNLALLKLLQVGSRNRRKAAC